MSQANVSYEMANMVKCKEPAAGSCTVIFADSGGVKLCTGISTAPTTPAGKFAPGCIYFKATGSMSLPSTPIYINYASVMTCLPSFISCVA